MKSLLVFFFAFLIIPAFAENITTNDIEKLKNQVDNLSAKSDALQNLNSDLNKRVETIDEKYGNIEEKLNDIKIRIGDVETNIDDIEAGSNDFGLKLDTLLLDHNATKITDTATNIVSIGLAVSSIVLAGVLFAIQHGQGKNLTKVISETKDLANKVHTVTEYLDKRIKGKERYTAFVLNSKLDLVIRELTHQLGLHEKWQKETDPTRKNNFFNSLKNSYDRCFQWINLGITPLELRDIFEDHLAGMIQTITTKLSIHSSVYFLGDSSADEEIMLAFIVHIEECKGLCENLKKEISPMVSNQVQNSN